jgi:hypothetical protein
MTTTGVGPQAAGMILRARPSLKQKLMPAVEDEDRERAMQSAVAVRAQFLFRTDCAVTLIYENDILRLHWSIDLRPPIE